MVRADPKGWHYLLLRAYRNWDFPKGMVEPGEEPLEAATREVCEETTIDDLEYRWGDVHYDTGPYTRNKIARYFLAATRCEVISLPVNPLLGVPEHHAWRWVAGDEALALASPRVRNVVLWARQVLT